MDRKTYENVLVSEISKIPGGYIYEGICSVQYCFQLKNDGELRFSACDDDTSDGRFHFDHYDGSLPPGITGFVVKTNNESERDVK